jgi:non-homologous end joining protein Ku
VELTPDAAQAKLVSKVIDGHGVEPFDHESFVSQYATRRLKVIDEALSGAPSTVEAKPAATVDLMSALLASGDEIVKATAKPKRKKATAKA